MIRSFIDPHAKSIRRALWSFLILATALAPVGARAAQPGVSEVRPSGRPVSTEAQRLTDLADPRVRPTLPGRLNRPGRDADGTFRICVSTEGRVTDVKVIAASDPQVRDGWIDPIRRWRYRPASVDGKPIASCHLTHVRVRAPIGDR